VPDEPFFGVSRNDALDDLVRCFVLLVASDNLDSPLLLVGGVCREIKG
jgi:hypothetical protein